VLPYEDPQGGRPLALVVEDADQPGLRDRCSVITIAGAWRVIATMNVFEKSLLFEQSFALMRLFAFIEVPTPSPEVYQTLVRQQLANDDTAMQECTQRVVMALLALRSVKELGPALSSNGPVRAPRVSEPTLRTISERSWPRYGPSEAVAPSRILHRDGRGARSAI
jgi:hypothetical protein